MDVTANEYVTALILQYWYYRYKTLQHMDKIADGRYHCSSDRSYRVRTKRPLQAPPL